MYTIQGQAIASFAAAVLFIILLRVLAGNAGSGRRALIGGVPLRLHEAEQRPPCSIVRRCGGGRRSSSSSDRWGNPA